VRGTPGTPRVTLAALETILAKLEARDRREVDRECDSLPTRPHRVLDFARAWLVLYAKSAGKKSPPGLSKLVTRLAADRPETAVPEEKIKDLVSRYGEGADLFLKRHHWVVRNFLAQRLFYIPDVVDHDGWLLPFSTALASFAVLRLAVLETLENGVPGNLTELASEIDQALSHTPALEKEWRNLTTRTLPNPEALFFLVKLVE
jgi:hypothetical protein